MDTSPSIFLAQCVISLAMWWHLVAIRSKFAMIHHSSCRLSSFDPQGYLNGRSGKIMLKAGHRHHPIP